MCDPEGPLFTSLPQFTRVPFQAKELKSQYTRPLSKKIEILVFTALMPQFEISVHKTLLSEAKNSSQVPQFGNSGRTPLPEKKRLSAPSLPRGEVSGFAFDLDAKAWTKNISCIFICVLRRGSYFQSIPRFPVESGFFLFFFFFFFFNFLFIFFRFPFYFM